MFTALTISLRGFSALALRLRFGRRGEESSFFLLTDGSADFGVGGPRSLRGVLSSAKHDLKQY